MEEELHLRPKELPDLHLPTKRPLSLIDSPRSHSHLTPTKEKETHATNCTQPEDTETPRGGDCDDVGAHTNRATTVTPYSVSRWGGLCDYRGQPDKVAQMETTVPLRKGAEEEGKEGKVELGKAKGLVERGLWRQIKGRWLESHSRCACGCGRMTLVSWEGAGCDLKGHWSMA